MAADVAAQGDVIAQTRARRLPVSRFFHRHPRVRLLALLSAPLAWLVVAYLASLLALFLTSLWRIDSFTFDIVKKVGAQNFSELLTKPVYRTIALRTIGIAAAVTIIDMLIAIPVAFAMAKVAKPKWRPLLLFSVVMPLWVSYLVKNYAWRAILDPGGGILRRILGHTPGFGVIATIIVLAYLWLPYMITPIYAGFERLPDSVLEASTDLGATARVTFRRVILPMMLPAIVAGSIFTFSLALGDYITVGIVGGTTQMVGNVVAREFGANNVPFAAALATVPVAVMVIYLLVAKVLGAFESL